MSLTTPPAAPTELAASIASATSVSLHWSDNSVREMGYQIQRSTDDKTFTQVGTVGENVASYTSASLTTGKKYYFRVRAYNQYGDSSFTNVASATPASGNTSITSTKTPAPSTAKAPVDGPFYNGVSVNTHDDPSILIPILKKLGVKSVRLWWQMDTWESRGGAAAMSIREAQAYHAAGFNVMMNVDAPEVPTTAQAIAFFKYIGSQKSALAAVNLWEIGNEPDRPPYWQGTAAQYVNIILKSAWDVLHPLGAKILGAGPSWDPGYAQLMVNAGYLNYCDYAGMHPYGYSVSEVIERATEAAKIYGSKPLILSEWNVRGATSPAQWVSELEQIAPALKKVSDEAFYFCLMKCDTMAGPGGLITPTFTPNGPFFEWYQSAAAE